MKKQELLFCPKNGYDRITAREREAMQAYGEGYKTFLDVGKVERDAIDYAIALAEKKGFRPFDGKTPVQAGDKIYLNVRGKTLFLAVMGRQPLSEGFHLVAAHADAPSLHVKPNPMYEDSDLAYLKTHYYGGVRKYQWVAVPLELRGVFVCKDGTKKRVSIGQDPGDPVFTMTDLLPHLGQKQNQKTLAEGIEGEQLNLLIGSRPAEETEGEDRIKQHLLAVLHEKYGVVEEDFLSAELVIVPAFDARDIGLDRSMIGAYGHDDRVCCYPALTALLDTENPEKTAITALVDKEEVGSNGVTGMQSAAFDAFLEDLCDLQGVKLRHCYAKSFCLSADVCAAYDPTFPEVFDKRNTALLNRGPGITKYTGSRGKAGCSDASAEVMATLRGVFDANGVLWQTTEMGKVDAGGGGTISAYIANRNIDVVDVGVPVLSMHAPFETISKLDLYMAHKGFAALFAAKA